jgi:hypothetical protein
VLAGRDRVVSNLGAGDKKLSTLAMSRQAGGRPRSPSFFLAFFLSTNGSWFPLHPAGLWAMLTINSLVAWLNRPRMCPQSDSTQEGMLHWFWARTACLTF